MAHHDSRQHGSRATSHRALPERPPKPAAYQPDPCQHGPSGYQTEDQVYQPTGDHFGTVNSRYTSPQHLKAYQGYGYGHDDYDDYEPDDTQYNYEEPLPDIYTAPLPPRHATRSTRHAASDPLHLDSPIDDGTQNNFFDPTAALVPPRRPQHHHLQEAIAYTSSTYLPTESYAQFDAQYANDYQDHVAQNTLERSDLQEQNLPRPLSDVTSHLPPIPPTHSSPITNSPSHPRARPLPGPPTINTSVSTTHKSLRRKSVGRQSQAEQTQDQLFEEVENAILNAGTPSSSLPPLPHPDTRDAGPGADAYQNQDPDSDTDYEADAGLAALRAAEDEDRIAQLRHDFRRQSDTSSSRRQSVSSWSHSSKPSAGLGNVNGGPSSPDRHLSHNSAAAFEHDLFYPPATVDDGLQGGLVEPDGRQRRPSFDEGDEYDFQEHATANAAHHQVHDHHDQNLPTGRPLPPPPPTARFSDDHAVTNLRDQPWLPYPVDPLTIMPTPPPLSTVPRSASMLQVASAPKSPRLPRSKTDAIDRAKRQSGRLSTVPNPYSSFEPTPLGSPVAMDLPSLPSKRFNPNKLTALDFKKCKEPWALSGICRWLDQITNPEEYTELRESEIRTALIALFTHKVPTLNIADAELLAQRVHEDMYSAGTLQRVEEWVKLIPGNMSGVLFQLSGLGCYSPSVHDNEMSGRCYAHHCQRTVRKADMHLKLSAKASTDWATFYRLNKEQLVGHEPKEIERQNILHEIVNTEHDFMSQLDIVRQLYRDSLAHASPPVIAPPRRLHAFLREVFGKIDAIKQANQDNLLPQLKYRQTEQGPWIRGFSDLFRQWIRKAKTAYIDYAADFPKAVLLIRQETERNLTFRSFLDDARNNQRAGKLGWDTYLKAPITRLQRYSLLLSTVNKSMKSESEEKTELELAIAEIKAVTLECDTRVAENQRKVDLEDWNKKLILRPEMQKDVALNLTHLGREMVYRGDLQRTGGSRFNWLDCHALLFDHYFVLAKSVFVAEKGTGTKVEKYDVSRLPIPMDLLVLDSFDDPPVMKSTYIKGLTSVSAVPTRPSAMDLSRLGRTLTNSPAPGSPVVESHKASQDKGYDLHHTQSAPVMVTTTTLGEVKDSEKIVYPFKIKHLGRKDPYILFAPTAANRAEWANKIVEAKTKHATSLYAQSAEPFGLRVIADSAFGYEYSSDERSRTVTIKGTPIDRAIRDSEAVFAATAGAPPPVCRAKINCATSFTAPGSGKQMVVVGSDFGIYLSASDNFRGWVKTLNMAKVTQLAVLEDFNLLLFISNGTLISYHLDAFCDPGSRSRPSTASRPGSHDSSTNTAALAKTAPQKLSGSKDVNFFATGRMKDRMLIIYKKRDGVSSSFKILEPVYAKATERARNRRNTTNTSGPISRTESFRVYDEFVVATECTGINFFYSTLALGTPSRNFEVLGIEKLKTSFSVPDLRAPEVGNIASHVDGQATLGMFRLNDQEFLAVYESCAVYINRYGDVSRSAIMNFVGKAKVAALATAGGSGGGGGQTGSGQQAQQYLVLFDPDFVEVRNAMNGRLKQIIAGKEVKCLDSGQVDGTARGPKHGLAGPGSAPSSRTIKFAMQHPENEKVQILLEMVADEGRV